MKQQPLHLAKALKAYFSPKVIGEVNDVYVKVAVLKGEDIPWHTHEKEDEMFYVLQGEMLMEIQNQPSLVLKAGDMYIVKKGTMHRVSAQQACHIMLIENKTTAHTGNVVSAITKSIEAQREQN